MNIQPLLPTAIHAAEEACKVILDVYNSGDFQAEAKGDNSPLTLADKKAHHKICDILQSTGLPILSEEGKSIPFEERKQWQYFWMVDPLDGTKEFIKRNGDFTVNIALIHQGVPVLGVVAYVLEIIILHRIIFVIEEAVVRFLVTVFSFGYVSKSNSSKPAMRQLATEELSSNYTRLLSTSSTLFFGFENLHSTPPTGYPATGN